MAWGPRKGAEVHPYAHRNCPGTAPNLGPLLGPQLGHVCDSESLRGQRRDSVRRGPSEGFAPGIRGRGMLGPARAPTRWDPKAGDGGGSPGPLELNKSGEPSHHDRGRQGLEDHAAAALSEGRKGERPAAGWISSGGGWHCGGPVTWRLDLGRPAAIRYRGVACERGAGPAGSRRQRGRWGVIPSYCSFAPRATVGA